MNKFLVTWTPWHVLSFPFLTPTVCINNAHPTDTSFYWSWILVMFTDIDEAFWRDKWIQRIESWMARDVSATKLLKWSTDCGACQAFLNLCSHVLISTSSQLLHALYRSPPHGFQAQGVSSLRNWQSGHHHPFQPSCRRFLLIHSSMATLTTRIRLLFSRIIQRRIYRCHGH